MDHPVDAAFLALPFRTLADAALGAARAAGAEHADFGFQRINTGAITVRDHAVQANTEAVTAGYAVRVVVDGVWGFAASVVPTPEAAWTAGRLSRWRGRCAGVVRTGRAGR